MKKLFIPLFWKFVLGILFAIALFNSLHIYFIWNSIKESLHYELNLRGIFIAKSIAERSLSYQIYDEVVELNKLMDETKKIDSSIAYVFVLDGNKKVVSHTFEKGVPIDLINANPVSNNQTRAVLIEPSNTNGKYIRDIATPILDNKIGTVRVGLFEDIVRAEANLTFNYLITLVYIFLIIGLLLALLFSYIITTPIKFISQTADSINIDSLHLIIDHKKRFENNFFFKIRRMLYSYDEIDILYNKFIDMIDRLQKANKELESANTSLILSEKMASIGILAAGIAHEINNPMTGLLNCIRRISNDPENKKQNMKYLELMNEAATKVELVVQGLLNFSRKQEFELLPTDLRIPLHNSLLLSAYHLESNLIPIRNTIPKEVPLIACSLNHLEQVFLNLIINSVDALVEKKKISANDFQPELHFEINFDNKHLYFFLHDNGIGIAENQLNKIFDPFFTTKKVGQGTGLGLAISFNIIKQHNGEINIKSEYSKGTSVCLSFPIISLTVKNEPQAVLGNLTNSNKR